MQPDAVRWSSDVANVRHSRPLGAWQRPVSSRPKKPKPCSPCRRRAFELATWSKVKVHPDIHVKVAKARYSIPWLYMGEAFDAEEGPRSVESMSEVVLIETRVRIGRRKQTDYADYLPERIAFLLGNPTWCRRPAAEIGPSASELVEVLMEGRTSVLQIDA